jgi:transposase
MPDARVVDWIREKYIALAAELDERGRRRWTAIEARSLGRGGLVAVAEATGISARTIRTGLRELAAGTLLPPYRQRREGAGRRSRQEEQPGVVAALEQLISPTTRGDPTNPLRWTGKSTRSLTAELRKHGFAVGVSTVRALLRELGYSLQGNRKTREGTHPPDRNAQFEHINARGKARKRRGEPALSGDTKKKEKLGNKSNSGREYEPKGPPRETDTHDFLDKKKGKVVPYGVYDIHRTEAVVAIGLSPDTAEFAVAAIRLWWTKLGKTQYAASKRLLITADSGGSNAARSRRWKLELPRLADDTGLLIEVCPYPPGTSKWNKIEHRLFCHSTRNWRGVPLETREIVVSSIGNTRTTAG